MKDKINKICTELNDGKIAVVQATEQLFDLYSVSQQRELLIAYEKYKIGVFNCTLPAEIDEFLDIQSNL